MAVSTDHLYWWHQRLHAEIARLGPANSRELASNLGEFHRDVLNWLDQLEAAGLVISAMPTRIVPGARWVMVRPIEVEVAHDAVA